MRPKGVPNRIGAAVKSNVIAVFDKIGGRDKMAEWAQENLTQFYQLYARLIPTEVTATIDVRDARELSDSELELIAAGGSPGVDVSPESETPPGELH